MELLIVGLRCMMIIGIIVVSKHGLLIVRLLLLLLWSLGWLSRCSLSLDHGFAIDLVGLDLYLELLFLRSLPKVFIIILSFEYHLVLDM
jgi:hypothetical protein